MTRRPPHLAPRPPFAPAREPGPPPPPRGWRPPSPAGLVLAAATLALAGCPDGDLAAVSVRWRLVDKRSGLAFDPRSHPGPDGSCRCTATDDPLCDPGWIVHRVQLVVLDPGPAGVGASPVDVPPERLRFDCRVREGTTAFVIPGGTWALTLRAFDPATPAVDEAVAPAPTVHVLRNGVVANLDLIELAVSPLPLVLPDAGADDGGQDAASPR